MDHQPVLQSDQAPFLQETIFLQPRYVPIASALPQ